MNEQPLVSVVIATYNMGQYLPLAIDSVLNQTWTNLEVVVVDDGSEDDTREQMKKYGGDPRVRYIPTENKGQPQAKNRGLQEAKGDFIAFCDADDLWQPHKLEVQIPCFDNEDVGVVYSEVSYIDQHGEPVDKETPYERYSGVVTDKLVIKNFVPFGTAVIRRSCMEEDGAFDEDLPMGIDWDLWLRYSMNWQFQYVPDKTYTYRIWPGQMSKNYRGRYKNAFLILNKFLETHPNALPKAVQANAWADMYVSRGMSLATAEKLFFQPLKDVLTGLRYNFFFLPGWKALLKLLLGRARV
ncbi:glycosyltransferase family 2 protein [Marinobacter sp. bablab_jr008]|uniref:glycosyltransferase family 2 protein n=1 Tax=Marinobacter sp. bablab_jr008 TaxID=2755064 RepID=UPI0018F25D8A|nr:glycosyltransferase [Marinobacter sp. bablab_jr008]